MAVDFEELESWFTERPKWLQDAARRLVERESLTDEDVQELLQICTAEGAEPDAAVVFRGIPPGGLAVVDIKPALRLVSISEVRGVNALSPTRPLEFSDSDLCVVYGGNGTGKSGYVRLLKHASGARNPGALLGNVFLPDLEPPGAAFAIVDGTAPRSVIWRGAPLADLQGMDVFDTSSGLFYVNEESEITFEPWLLRLFSRLTDACGVLGGRVRAEIAAKASGKPCWPVELGMSAGSAWYAGLSNGTTIEEVAQWTTWSGSDESALAETEKRLGERDHAATAQSLRRRKDLVHGVVAEFKGWLETLSDERCAVYQNAKQDASVRRQTADDDARRVFESSPVDGVGSESWRALWEAARRFSETKAYPELTFPRVANGAHCVLCQQELLPQGRDRMSSFEAFVKSELQQRARQAEETSAELRARFSVLPKVDELPLRMDAMVLPVPLRDRLSDAVARLEERRRNCIDGDGVGASLPDRAVVNDLEAYASELEDEASRADADARGQNKPALEERRKELAGRRWLAQQQHAIATEVARLQKVASLEAADRLTNTQALSRRKSDLADELVSRAYVERFQRELRTLGASRLRLELRKTRTEVGHVYHRIVLVRGAQPARNAEVFSEGELRLVSLAAFLADSEGREGKVPFILDDPISSLDHEYEEMVARRLVELARSRQVIVFTHRLSLLAHLRDEAKKVGVSGNVVSLSRYAIGEVGNLPIDLQNTKRAANGLLNERLAAAKKAFRGSDAEYEPVAKGLCRDIRVLLERVVEDDLLNEVVRRFHREVHTKGRIHALAGIDQADCDLVDQLMTKYSAFEHSQPGEAPIALPSAEELASDLEAIAGLIVKTQERNERHAGR